MRRVVILGSTGSIGVQALDVVERSGELEVVGLAAHSSFERLIAQAEEFGVKRVALGDEAAAARAGEAWTGGEVLAGNEGLVDLIVNSDCDLVLNALMGSAGGGPPPAGPRGGTHPGLAHKGALGVGGGPGVGRAPGTRPPRGPGGTRPSP